MSSLKNLYLENQKVQVSVGNWAKRCAPTSLWSLFLGKAKFWDSKQHYWDHKCLAGLGLKGWLGNCGTFLLIYRYSFLSLNLHCSGFHVNGKKTVREFNILSASERWHRTMTCFVGHAVRAHCSFLWWCHWHISFSYQESLQTDRSWINTHSSHCHGRLLHQRAMSWQRIRRNVAKNDLIWW